MSTETKVKTAAAESAKTATTPLHKLRSHCLSKGFSGIMSFAKLFGGADDDDTWVLSEKELGKAVSDAGLKLTEAEVKELYKQFQTDGKEGVSFDEFLNALRPDMNPARLSIVDAAYKKLDKSGDGVVTLEDLKLVYNAKKHPKVVKGEMTEDQVLLRFMKSFEGPGPSDGKLTRQEFVNYFASMSTAFDEDDEFVDIVKRMWNLK